MAEKTARERLAAGLDGLCATTPRCHKVLCGECEVDWLLGEGRALALEAMGAKRGHVVDSPEIHEDYDFYEVAIASNRTPHLLENALVYVVPAEQPKGDNNGE